MSPPDTFGRPPDNTSRGGSSDAGLRRWLADAVWRRHANPRSGWTRVAVLPVLMYGLYARKPRLVAAVLGFSVLNPVLFPPPENADAWMTRVVLGERMYYRHRERRRPADLLSYGAGAFTAAAVVAALRRRPVRTACFTAVGMAAKFAFVAVVARYYEANRERYPEDVPEFDRR